MFFKKKTQAREVKIENDLLNNFRRLGVIATTMNGKERLRLMHSMFQMGSMYGSMSYLAITASDLSDRMLADFLDMESSQIVTMPK